MNWRSASKEGRQRGRLIYQTCIMRGRLIKERVRSLVDEGNYICTTLLYFTLLCYLDRALRFSTIYERFIYFEGDEFNLAVNRNKFLSGEGVMHTYVVIARISASVK